MTKQEHIDFIRNEIGQDFHYKQVEIAIDHVYRQVAHNVTREGVDGFDFLTKEYSPVTVTLDSTTQRYYSLLPEEIIQFTDPNEGIRNINTTQGTDLNFYPTSERNVMLTAGLALDNVMTRIGYYVRHDRVWYYNMDPGVAGVGVRMVLAVPFTAYGDDDAVSLPSGQDFNIIQAAIDMLLQKQPEKIREDG